MTRENSEKMLTTDETTRYAFIESGCLCKDKKTSTANGDSNARSILKIYSKWIKITVKNSIIHNGAARYHLGSTFLASVKKSTEPANEIILNKGNKKKAVSLDDVFRCTKIINKKSKNITDINDNAIFILVKP